MLTKFDCICNRSTMIIICLALLVSCKRDYTPPPVDPPAIPTKHILLKDITIPNLPSPYYHFEYNSDSLITKADFGSGFTMYDIFYSGGRVSEMRNNIIVNHDTLRYSYDQGGKLTQIRFINEDNIVYRHVDFTYNGNLIEAIKWDRKLADGSFFTDRTLSFAFYVDGNVKTITEHRPPVPGGEEYNSVRIFEEYDDKINVDDFSWIHDGIHDHFFLLQGFRLQKNNPKRERLSVNGTDLYTDDYTYTYNEDNTPSHKAGDFIYLSGPNAGQKFKTNTFYTYY